MLCDTSSEANALSKLDSGIGKARRRVLVGLAAISSGRPAHAQEPVLVASVEGITEYRLANGLRVILVPDASSPQITVVMTYFVGGRHEGYGESGSAHLLEHMLLKGTRPPRRSVPRHAFRPIPGGPEPNVASAILAAEQMAIRNKVARRVGRTDVS